MPIPDGIVSLAAEMYGDGWGLQQIADFLNAARVREKPFGKNSFLRQFDRRGIKRRPKGRPRKAAAA